MTYMDWNAGANIPQQNLTDQQGALAAIQLVNQQRVRNALAGVSDPTDQAQVATAMHGLLAAGALDQAKSLYDLQTAAATNRYSTPNILTLGSLMQGKLAQLQGALQGQPQPAESAQSSDSGASGGSGAINDAHQQAMDWASQSLNNLADMAGSPGEQSEQAAVVRQEAAQRGFPQPVIDEALSSMKADDLRAHAAAITGDGEHPTGMAASRGYLSSQPGVGGSDATLNDPLYSDPLFRAYLTKQGFDVGPGIDTAVQLTQPQRTAPYQPVQYTGAHGETLTTSASNFANSQTPGAQPFAGPTLAVQDATSAAAQAPYQPVQLPPGPAGQQRMESASQFAAAHGGPSPESLGVPSGGTTGGVEEGPTPAAMVTSTASGQQYVDARASAAKSIPAAYALKQMVDLIPQTNIGPGTQLTNELRAFVHANAPQLDAMIPGMAERVEQTGNYDQLNKYMVQYASQAASAFGQGTDNKLAVAFSGNPNTHLSQLGAQDLARAATATFRAQNAAPLYFASTGNDPSEYGAFAASYPTTIDPRAFAMDLMTPTERSQMISQIAKEGTSAQQRFVTGEKAAMAAGYYSRADLAAWQHQ